MVPSSIHHDLRVTARVHATNSLHGCRPLQLDP